MMTTTIPDKIKKYLHESLGHIGAIQDCALLDYPNHKNIGDHLIWLGNIFYLTDVLKTNINYIASAGDFSDDIMGKQVGKSPILLHGGGNLGDIWASAQRFREYIISRYQDRRIIILPQSIYFRSQAKLEQSAKVFNSHPNLTLFTRDNYSYELATKHFWNCQIFKAPDTAFQMVGMPGLSSQSGASNSILFLSRTDKESNQLISPKALTIPNLVIEDWVAYHRQWSHEVEIKARLKKKFNWVLGQPESRVVAGLSQFHREVWQRGVLTPREWWHRQQWQLSHDYNTKFDHLYDPAKHRLSLSFMYSGMYQLKQYRLVITNRLHGHILCILLGIPHIFLPNSYYKNEGFYETWTYEVPFCRFVKDVTHIKGALEELDSLGKNTALFK